MSSNSKFHIAIIGTRGIPANYGGFETFAEELSTRLAASGYDVTVYGRKGQITWPEQTYKGVKLVLLPAVKNKYLETVVHTFLCALHVCFTKVNVVYFCNAINSIFMIFPRLFGKKVIINVDGLEWKRKKWNKIGKSSYQISEWFATILAHKIISDSRGIQEYYRKKFAKETVYISYGAAIPDYEPPAEVMSRLNLKKREYILYVSRLEPENNAHILIKAFEKVKTEMPLVVVGDAPYNKRYIAQLKSTKDHRIKFAGSIYGKGCHELRSNAFLYIHGNEVGGTNPALLEAMASGNCVIVNGVNFNKEVIADTGLWFKPEDSEDLKEKIEFVINNPQKNEECRIRAVERIKQYYSWDEVVRQYERLFDTL